MPAARRDPMVLVALAMAENAHAGMVRPNKARQPCLEHLKEVADLVASHGGGPEDVAAALLHDSVEDTSTTLDRIREALGDRVALLVDGLTDPPDFAAMPLAERKALQADRLRSKDASVHLVKIADQISNVRSVAMDPPLDWDGAKCMEYADGAKMIVEAVRETAPDLAAIFDEAYGRCAAAHLASPKP